MIPLTDALSLFTSPSVGRWLFVTLVFVLALRLLNNRI